MATRDLDRSSDQRWQPTAAEIVLMTVETLGFVGQLILAILFYNIHGWEVATGLGWAALALAAILGGGARVALQERGGAREANSWLHTQNVVSTGVYALVSHAMYLSFLLMSLSLVLLAPHWINALLSVAVMRLLHSDMVREERTNLKRFGERYSEYMRQVPRMNLLVGMVRFIKRRGGSSNS